MFVYTCISLFVSPLIVITITWVILTSFLMLTIVWKQKGHSRRSDTPAMLHYSQRKEQQCEPVLLAARTAIVSL
jgi:hypothetical protein